MIDRSNSDTRSVFRADLFVLLANKSSIIYNTTEKLLHRLVVVVVAKFSCLPHLHWHRALCHRVTLAVFTSRSLNTDRYMELPICSCPSYYYSYAPALSHRTHLIGGAKPPCILPLAVVSPMADNSDMQEGSVSYRPDPAWPTTSSAASECAIATWVFHPLIQNLLDENPQSQSYCQSNNRLDSS